MDFWDAHDLELLKTRKEMILLINQFREKNSPQDKNYYRKLDRLMNKKFGRKMTFLTNIALSKSVQSMVN